MLERSNPGEVPTLHERELIAHTDTARVSDAMGQWTLLAQRVGLTAVLAVLDEFASEKIFIPSRRAFFDALWRPQRDHLVRQLKANGHSASEIGEKLGISRQHVANILTDAGADSDAVDVVKGAR